MKTYHSQQKQICHIRFRHIYNMKSGWLTSSFTCKIFFFYTYSRTLQAREQNNLLVEKEAQARVESIYHQKRFLLGRHFTLLADQCSVSYLYDYKTSSKIKNNKIMRWRVLLSPYSYDIHYHLCNCNHPPDTFTRVGNATISQNCYLVFTTQFYVIQAFLVFTVL